MNLKYLSCRRVDRWIGFILSFAFLACSSQNQNGGESEVKLTKVSSWAGKETVTYCIDSTFGEYRNQIIELSAMANGEWSQYGNINLVHTECNNRQNITYTRTTDGPRGTAQTPSEPAGVHLTLKVRLSEGNGQLLSGGQLLVDRAYGVILHEVGHTLGFVHEHESEGSLVTARDGRSIMYYPFESGSWHQAGWSDGWDRARLSMLDRIGMMTTYPPKKLIDPVNASPELFSEEEGTSSCEAGSVVNGIACYGAYCDQKRLFCARPTASAQAIHHVWAGPISEEDPQMLHFEEESFISAMHCRGRFCDDVSLLFTSFDNVNPSTQCYNSDPISEEPGTFGQNYFHICKKDHAVTGLACSGRFCDTLTVRCCLVQ